MNTERIKELAREAGFHIELNWDHTDWHSAGHSPLFEKFAELIIKDCVDTLEFHGFEDTVPYIKWMATNKLGVEE